MKGLDKHVFLLSLSKKLNGSLVLSDYAHCENFLILSFLLDLLILNQFIINAVAAFADFFSFKFLSLDTKLEIELTAVLERNFSIICISLDIIKKPIRCILV